FYDKTTHQLLDHQGLPKQDLTSVPKGPDHPLAEVPKHEDVTVGAPKHQEVTVGGGNTHHVTGTADHPIAGGTTHTPGGAVDHTPGGTAGHTPGGTADHTPHNSHTEPGGTTGGHGGTDTTPTGGGHGDTPSTGGHGDGPSTGGGDHGAGHGDGPTVPHQGDGPGGGSLPDGPHGGADDGILPGGSEPRPDGARYIEEPTAEHVKAAKFYDEVRANPEHLDIGAISDNTGISTQVLDRVRTHFFLTEHVVPEGPALSRHGYFTPRSDIAEIWEAAGKRELTPAEATKFERYIGHEYVESQLMEAGLPYTVDAPHLWESFQNGDGPIEYYREFPGNPHEAGAHDLAVNEGRGGFGQWERAGFDLPKVDLASDLSNIDEVVAALKDELRAKGIELK
ncbi:hypothetical protein ABZ766_28755, partial [Streptomyces sp. NPDC006670]